MPPQLTVKQFAAITLGQAAPPWHLGRLLQIYGDNFISVKSLISSLSSSTTVMFVVMLPATKVSQFASAFAQAVAGGSPETAWTYMWCYEARYLADLKAFNQLLSTVGASIVYLSPQQVVKSGHLEVACPAWTVIGIAGTYAGLANLSVQQMPWYPGWSAADLQILTKLTSGFALVATSGLNPNADPYAEYLTSFLPYPGPMVTDMFIVTGG
jgi:hypothetical protein